MDESANNEVEDDDLGLYSINSGPIRAKAKVPNPKGQELMVASDFGSVRTSAPSRMALMRSKSTETGEF